MSWRERKKKKREKNEKRGGGNEKKRSCGRRVVEKRPENTSVTPEVRFFKYVSIGFCQRKM